MHLAGVQWLMYFAYISILRLPFLLLHMTQCEIAAENKITGKKCVQFEFCRDIVRSWQILALERIDEISLFARILITSKTT